MRYDILLRGGEVIDPGDGVRGIRDVAISEGRIVAVAETLGDAKARWVVDARGHYVVPGLIDMHVHAYTHSPYGLDADTLCAAGGVTTMLDTGSAGSDNFPGFRREIAGYRTQVLALINLSAIGLASSSVGELLDHRYSDPAGVVRAIRRHPDVAIGVKIRAGAHIIGQGEQGWTHLREAIKAARDSGTWLMVHIGECPMSIPELCEALAPGDCITHCFKGGSTRVTDDQGKIHPEVRAAAARGVLFDVGHGSGSFQWKVAEAALAQGFEPTTISTDLHTLNIHGPVYDMPTTMSKFLMLGVPIERVIEMSTTRPARILKQEKEIGTLRVGTIADVAVLERHHGRFVFTDSYGENRVGRELLTAAATVRRGELLPGGGGARMRHLAD